MTAPLASPRLGPHVYSGAEYRALRGTIAALTEGCPALWGNEG